MKEKQVKLPGLEHPVSIERNGGKKSVNAVWSYEKPFPAVGHIRGHVAFYPDRVDEIAGQFPNVRDVRKDLTDWIPRP